MSVLAIEARDSGQFSDELIAMFYAMTKRARTRSRRFREMEQDDALQSGAIACVQATAAYRGGSAYSYFSRVIFGRLSELFRNAHMQKAQPDGAVLSLERDFSKRRHGRNGLQDVEEKCDLSTEECIDYAHYRQNGKT